MNYIGSPPPACRFPELRRTSEVQGERKVKLACFSEPQPSLAMHFLKCIAKVRKKSLITKFLPHLTQKTFEMLKFKFANQLGEKSPGLTRWRREYCNLIEKTIDRGRLLYSRINFPNYTPFVPTCQRAIGHFAITINLALLIFIYFIIYYNI